MGKKNVSTRQFFTTSEEIFLMGTYKFGGTA
jgi:hypothetical protein